MTSALVLVAVLVPALAYGALLYVFDVHEREPLPALLLMFAVGALCVPVALYVEIALDGLLPFLDGMRAGRRGAVLLGCFVVIAPVEELLKLGAVYLAARRFMNEPVDGVVYAGTAALGFAAAEGVWAGRDASGSVLLLRALLAMPGHLCFSALWGAGLGALQFWGRPMWPAALVSLCASLLAHGTYDFVLIDEGGKSRSAVVAVLIASGVLASVLFRTLLVASPFRRLPLKPGACTTCRRPHAARARFCAGCGAALVESATPVLPIGFVSTLLSFVAQILLLFSGSVLAAKLLGGSAHGLWDQALAAPSAYTAAVWLVVGSGALISGSLAAGWGGRHAVLEALLASALCVLCTMLFVALAHPQHLLRAVTLIPLSLGASAAAAYLLARRSRAR